MSDDLEAAEKHLAELADGWECGAKVEGSIVAAFQPELDDFDKRSKDSGPDDIRLIRAVLDARDNSKRFSKDAEETRTVLAALTAALAEVKRLAEALEALTFAARTSGGTAGPDLVLRAACDASEAALTQQSQAGGGE